MNLKASYYSPVTAPLGYNEYVHTHKKKWVNTKDDDDIY